MFFIQSFEELNFLFIFSATKQIFWDWMSLKLWMEWSKQLGLTLPWSISWRWTFSCLACPRQRCLGPNWDGTFLWHGPRPMGMDPSWETAYWKIYFFKCRKIIYILLMLKIKRLKAFTSLLFGPAPEPKSFFLYKQSGFVLGCQKLWALPPLTQAQSKLVNNFPRSLSFSQQPNGFLSFFSFLFFSFSFTL